MSRRPQRQTEKALARDLQFRNIRLFLTLCLIVVFQVAAMVAAINNAHGYALNPNATKALINRAEKPNNLAASVEKIIHALTIKFNWFDASAEEQYRDALLEQLSSQDGHAILISNDLNKFAQFNLMQSDVGAKAGLVVELQEASFDNIFRTYEIDKALWPELIRRFNLEGKGVASTGSTSYTMVHDYQNGSWILSVETGRDSDEKSIR